MRQSQTQAVPPPGPIPAAAFALRARGTAMAAAERPGVGRRDVGAEERRMYRVTLQTRESDGLELRVPNQDLGRVLALVNRLQMLNPSFRVAYTPLHE